MRKHQAALLAVCASWATPALAFEAGEIDGEPVRVNAAVSTSILATVDNRNTRPADVSSHTDDNWGLVYTRFSLRGNWGDWDAGVRVDNAWFYRSPNPTQVALDLTDLRREQAGRQDQPYSADDGQFFRDKLLDANSDLTSRYINWTYPSKYHVGYTSKHVDFTVGDFYGQLGRGLVLSLRKVDELGSDTTIRGARMSGRFELGDVNFKLTGLGGTANPLRIDQASGRYLAVDSSVKPNVINVTEAGMPTTIDTVLEPNPSPTYAPDAMFGGELIGGPKLFKLGVHGATFRRQEPLTNDLVRTAKNINAGSVSLDVPDLGGKGAAYLEVAVQDLDLPDEAARAEDQQIDAGHAVYASVTLLQKPVALTLEGKHYRRFFPVLGNTDLGVAEEFSLQYNAPPTTEAFWVDTAFESFNTCVTGGRAKGDLRIGKNQTVFAWLGYYNTWAESVGNEQCAISDGALNRVWDAASGAEIKYSGGKSSASATIGARFDNTDRLINDSTGNQTTMFYQEGYLRYDWIQHLSGPFSLQNIGWHRRRSQTLGGPVDPWNEGENLTSLQWSQHGSIVFGFEYDTNPSTPATYLNGQIVYNIIDELDIAAFAGQRRGAIRCAAGVCRFFPPFEGGRLDVNLRF